MKLRVKTRMIDPFDSLVATSGLVVGRASYGASVWRQAGRATGCRRICYGQVHPLASMVTFGSGICPSRKPRAPNAAGTLGLVRSELVEFIVAPLA